jgi:TnpA family transposase
MSSIRPTRPLPSWARQSRPSSSAGTFTAYKAFAELGKAVKTLFLCRYLHSEALRREIHEGLNVIEQRNGANDFVFFARRGELASNLTGDYVWSPDSNPKKDHLRQLRTVTGDNAP